MRVGVRLVVQGPGICSSTSVEGTGMSFIFRIGDVSGPVTYTGTVACGVGGRVGTARSGTICHRAHSHPGSTVAGRGSRAGSDSGSCSSILRSEIVSVGVQSGIGIGPETSSAAPTRRAYPAIFPGVDRLKGLARPSAGLGGQASGGGIGDIWPVVNQQISHAAANLIEASVAGRGVSVLIPIASRAVDSGPAIAPPIWGSGLAVSGIVFPVDVRADERAIGSGNVVAPHDTRATGHVVNFRHGTAQALVIAPPPGVLINLPGPAAPVSVSMACAVLIEVCAMIDDVMAQNETASAIAVIRERKC